MPVHKNTTCALQAGYRPTCLCIKTQHVHFKKAINPRACAQKPGTEGKLLGQKGLKPTRIATKNDRKVAGSRDIISNPKAQRRGGPPLTRPRSFASPARTHDTKRKRRRDEADLPVTGGSHKGELTPLNLRSNETQLRQQDGLRTP